jgi:hypothetical protein
MINVLKNTSLHAHEKIGETQTNHWKRHFKKNTKPKRDKIKKIKLIANVHMKKIPKPKQCT